MKKILIYADEGVDESLKQEILKTCNKTLDQKKVDIILVNANNIKNQDWELDTRLLIIPGGRARSYSKSLGKEGNNRIITYVKNGGSFLGICAGAYYGAELTIFEKGGPLEIIDKGELNFFPGTAEGPAYGLGKFQYDTELGARTATIYSSLSGKKQNYITYFNGGCFFHLRGKTNENINIIAHYADLPNFPAAIVQCRVGKGQAILSGVHFEAEHTAANLQKADPNIKIALKNNKKTRKQFIDLLFKLLLGPSFT